MPPNPEWQHTSASNSRLTATLLNEYNYLSWAKEATLNLDGRGKLEYITGEEKRIEPKDPSHPTDDEKKKMIEWRRNDHLVMSWLISSMEPTLARFSLHSSSSKEMWDSLYEMFGVSISIHSFVSKEMYGVENNLTHIYNLQQELFSTKQGNRSNAEYLLQLKTKMDELKVYSPPTSDLKVLQQRATEDEIFLYLSGLNSSYEAIRANILQSTELPPFSKVVAQIQSEESRRARDKPLGWDLGGSGPEDHTQQMFQQFCVWYYRQQS